MLESIAVYIHWPYCLKKCPYCDFNSHVSASVDHGAWRDAYTREIAHYAEMLGARKVTSVFFGGGTPSLMEPQTVEHVLCEIARHWDVAKGCEITLEANPTSIESQKFKEFKSAGINRVSVGVQSLRDDQLQFLGREHSAGEALSALKTANETFDRVSFDLIYARPNQTLDEWRDELNEALQYAKGHISLYQLTIEDGTQFKVMRNQGRLTELDYDIAGDMYEMTANIMMGAGMPAYEISNYASEKQASRHNLTYWRYQDYVGIGPGAHGRITLKNGEKIATRTVKSPEKWLDQVQNIGHGARPFNILSPQDQLEERIMMGLRLREGVDIGHDLAARFLQSDAVQSLIDHGFLQIKNNRMFVPSDKWPVLDSVIAKVLMAL